LGAALAVQASAQDGFLPMFLLERSTNANVIHYEAKVARDGRLDPREPVIAYWIMAARDGHREPLNILERTKAYGFGIRRDGSSDSYTMTLVANSRKPIRVYIRDGMARAETSIDGHQAFLTRIFVTTRKGWILDDALSAELYGVDVLTGELRYEKLVHVR
jgi:hypothetical protein